LSPPWWWRGEGPAPDLAGGGAIEIEFTTGARMRIEITLSDVEPAVLRRVEGPFEIRRTGCLTSQAAMDWTNSHLYEFHAGDVGWSMPYPDADWSGDFLDARKPRLSNALEDVGTKKLVYRTLFDANLDRVVHNGYRIELSGDGSERNEQNKPANIPSPTVLIVSVRRRQVPSIAS
jgi:Plasmid pRiA4b ORF-3-like protein